MEEIFDEKGGTSVNFIGFTGTQHGMTVEQMKKLTEVLRRLRRLGWSEFHHGDCVGADAQAHYLAKSIGYHLVIHPPEDDSKRAWCTGGECLEPLPYLKRNRAIVLATELLIATPRGGVEELRSGTWSTIRFARKVGQSIKLITPEGREINE